MQSNSVLDRHRKVLGILYLVFGGLWAVGALVLLGMFVAGAMPTRPEDRAALMVMGGVLVIFLLALAALGIVGGMGMLKRRAWSKVLVLIAGILSLINFPVGTILGIYTLWFWFQPNTRQLFFPEPPAPRGPEPRGPDLRKPLVT